MHEILEALNVLFDSLKLHFAFRSRKSVLCLGLRLAIRDLLISPLYWLQAPDEVDLTAILRVLEGDFFIQTLDRHFNNTVGVGFLKTMLRLLLIANHQLGLFCLDVLQGGLFLRDFVRERQSKLTILQSVSFGLLINILRLLVTISLALFELLIGVCKTSVPLLDLKNIRELITVLVLNLTQEILELLQLQHFVIDECVLGQQGFMAHFSLLNLSIFLFDFQTLVCCSLEISTFASVLLGQEGAEPDQVVLNQDILLTQFFLSQSASLLLFFEFFLLIFEGLLYFIHEATLLK